ncbi:MAG: zinc-ribbon domain-containing protein [Candidatus Hodarchaeota archaeon]
MSPFCAYCGKSIRDSDKFCLYCGEPLLKSEAEPEIKEEEEELEVVEEEPKKEKKKDKKDKKGKKEEPTEESEEDEGETEDDALLVDDVDLTDLDPKIREELQARIDLYHLAKKIKKINDRITESIKLMDDKSFKQKYDLDEDFRKQNAIRFEALKQLGAEFKGKKNDLQSKISENFILEMNNKKIKRLKQQMEQLNNSFRLRKIDKKAYDKLSAEYKLKINKLLNERETTNIQLSMWISELKNEQEDLDLEYNMSKARKAAKEISKEELRDKKASVEKKKRKLDEDMQIIKKYIYKE